MECTVVTTKENKEQQLKNHMIIEKDTLHLKVAKINDKNSIII